METVGVMDGWCKCFVANGDESDLGYGWKSGFGFEYGFDGEFVVMQWDYWQF